VPSSSSSERAISESDSLAVREKIKCALRKRAESYEQLLELSGAIVEDHTYERKALIVKLSITIELALRRSRVGLKSWMVIA